MEAEETTQKIHKKRNSALEELTRGKGSWEKLEKEKEEEFKGLNGKIKRQVKAWKDNGRGRDERAREKKIS